MTTKDIKDLDIQRNGRPCIYSIKNNKNGKVYIGSATGHYRRKGQHYYMLRRNKHFSSHLQSSWNKYKEESFDFSVLEFIEDLDKMEERELYHIDKFDATNNKFGYNTRRDCRTNLGSKWPLESRLKFSLSKKGKVIEHLDYNENSKKMMKKVTATNIETKEEIQFNSIFDASIALKIDRTSISKALHKVIKRAGNYHWDFTEQSVLKNSVNSGKLQKDNPELSLVNDIKVTRKVQRLTSEESTNKLDTSAEQLAIAS